MEKSLTWVMPLMQGYKPNLYDMQMGEKDISRTHTGKDAEILESLAYLNLMMKH